MQPATLRAHRRTYTGVGFVDVAEVAERAGDHLPSLSFEYAPSIPALIRAHIGRDADLIRRPEPDDLDPPTAPNTAS